MVARPLRWPLRLSSAWSVKPVAPDVAEQAEQAEPVVEVVAYSAEIIDISGRVGDQFYDQYTDAANRAVGD